MTRFFTSAGLFLAMITAGPAQGRAQGLSAEEAVTRMKLAEGFEVQVVASEPLVRQPVAIEANRQDRDFLLVSLVDPSSVIRKEYVSLVVQTASGRVLTGLPISRSDASITLVDSRGERQTVASSEIEELYESSVSLMPENLYRQLRPEELRDLFAYLQSKK